VALCDHGGRRLRSNEDPAHLEASLFAAQPRATWRLPKRLNEISGLAVTSDGRVMGHDDERAVIYELDVASGRVTARIRLGDPVLRDDFEGLAIDGDDRFFLVTSAGRIHLFREGRDLAHVEFEVFDVGLSGTGEIEGAAWDWAGERVIMACKANYSPALQGALALYSWSPGTPDQRARPWLTVPVYKLAAAVGARAFHPSGIEVDQRTGRLVIVAATENAIVELDSRGQLIAARTLGREHRQPEGLAILPDGSLLIVDEARGAAARLTCYDRLAP